MPRKQSTKSRGTTPSHPKTPTGDKRARISQAEKDVSRGLKDTDRRGIPNDVPGPRKTAADRER